MDSTRGQRSIQMLLTAEQEAQKIVAAARNAMHSSQSLRRLLDEVTRRREEAMKTLEALTTQFIPVEGGVIRLPSPPTHGEQMTLGVPPISPVPSPKASRKRARDEESSDKLERPRREKRPMILELEVPQALSSVAFNSDAPVATFPDPRTDAHHSTKPWCADDLLKPTTHQGLSEMKVGLGQLPQGFGNLDFKDPEVSLHLGDDVLRRSADSLVVDKGMNASMESLFGYAGGAIANLCGFLEALNRRVFKVQKEALNSKFEHDKDRSRLQGLETDVEVGEWVASKYKKSLDRLVELTDEARAEADFYKEQFTEQNDKLMDALQDVNQLKDDNVKLQSDIDILRAELVEARRARAQVEVEVARLTSPSYQNQIRRQTLEEYKGSDEFVCDVSFAVHRALFAAPAPSGQVASTASRVGRSHAHPR